MAEFDKASAAELMRLTNVLKALSAVLGSDCTLDRARMFLSIAAREKDEEELYLHDLYESFPNVADTTVQRNVLMLADAGERGREGLGLIRATLAGPDRRRRRIGLETKGTQAIKKILAAASK